MLKTDKRYNRILSYLGVILLVAVGVVSILNSGGGGGDSDVDLGTEDTLVYTGATNPALITNINATTLLSNTFFGLGVLAVPLPVPTGVVGEQQASPVLLQNLLKGLVTKSLAVLKNRQTTGALIAGVAQPVEGVVLCDNGYTGTVTGTYDDATHLGVITVVYDNCIVDSVSWTGTVVFDLKAYDSTVWGDGWWTDILVSFEPRMSFSAVGINVSNSGTFEYKVDVATRQEILPVNLVSKNHISDKQIKFEHYQITMTYDTVIAQPNTAVLTYGGASGHDYGRVYDSIHGYVDVTTPTDPLYYSNLATLVFPDSGGPVVLAGANGTQMGPTHVRLTVQVGVWHGILIELDRDGDGVYEEPGYPGVWEDLITPQPLP